MDGKAPLAEGVGKNANHALRTAARAEPVEIESDWPHKRSFRPLI
jgi:hypothetical protein